MTRSAITAAALAAGLLVHTQGFAQVPINPGTSASTAANVATMSDAEKAARKTWRAVMKNIPVPGEGCFHVKYPNVAWESVECKAVEPRVHSVHANRVVGAAGAGNGVDWVAVAPGQSLISGAGGTFEGTSGVTSENGVGGKKGAIDGPNEYTLQLNTNNDQGTAACGDYIVFQDGGDCRVWQQFIYATDGYGSGTAALYMQYWLYGWTGTCPHGWMTPPNSTGTCYKNSAGTQLPDIPVTELGCCVVFEGTALAGQYDAVFLRYGDDWWSVYAADSSSGAVGLGSGVDIATVWNQAEFNIVGDLEWSEAYFNGFPTFVVTLQVEDGSYSAPGCYQLGTTGETNNLTLSTTCQTGVGEQIENLGYGPYIQFTESIPVPSAPCLSCGGGGGSPVPSPPPIEP